MIRRAVLYVFMVAALVGSIVISGSSVEPVVRPFSVVEAAGTPRVPAGVEAVTSTWFCAGTSAAGGEYGGEVVMSNTTDAPANAVVTVFTAAERPVVRPVELDPRSSTTLSIDELITAKYATVVVEVDERLVSVEQRALHPAGAAVSPCSTLTSGEWYVADGFTAEGSDFQLVLTNPYLSPAIIDFTIATDAGPRTPPSLQGFVVPAQSVRSIDIAEAGFRDEEILAVGAVASLGRFVMAKDQHYIGAGRLGHVLTLASPSTSDAWWFADGDKGAGITESYMVFNPSERDVQADLVFLGTGDALVPPSTLSIPANEVVRFDTADVALLPDGPHGVVVTGRDGAGIVVERVLTRPAGSSVATTVVLGAQDGVSSHRWRVPTSTNIAIEDVLVVLNTSAVDAGVSVYSVGPGGEEVVPGLVDLPVDANGIITIDLVDPLAFGRPLQVVSDEGLLIVERRLERTTSLRGRSGSLAIPE